MAVQSDASTKDAILSLGRTHRADYFHRDTAGRRCATAGASRFKAASRTGPLTGARQPLSLLDKEQVKVVVTMSAESVAEVRARFPDT